MSSENSLHAPSRQELRRQSSPVSDKERAALTALEGCFGRALGSVEWDRARARLVEFVSILRKWEQEIPADEGEVRKAA